MTIDANKPLRASLSSAGVSTNDVLLVDWPVFEADELDVFINSVDTPLVRGVDYNVTLKPPEFQTADVIVLAPMSVVLNGTDPIVIRNDLDFRQGYDASALQDLPPVGLELVLDRLALYARQLKQDFLETIKFAPGSGITFAGFFPDPIAEKFIRFSDDGLTLVADVDGASLASAKTDADRAEAAAARELGPFAVAPTVRADLSALQVGDEYFDTVANRKKVWDGAAWLTGVDSSTAVDIVGMPAIDSLAIADLVPAYDDSAAANAKVTLQKLWNSVAVLPVLAVAPAIDDSVLIYDFVATTAKFLSMAKLSNVLSNLTAMTAPALGDTLHIYDISVLDSRQVTPANFLKVINLFTEDTTPDLAADFVVTYDISGGEVKKVKLDKIGKQVVADPTNLTVTTSGTAIDITGLVAGINRIEIIMFECSTDGSSEMEVQIGDIGGIEAAGYSSEATDGGGSQPSTSGFILARNTAAAAEYSGVVTLTRHDGFKWVCHGGIRQNGKAHVFAGRKELTAELDRIRLTTPLGDDFDKGAFALRIQ